MSKKLISALLILCLVCLPLFALADGTLNVFNYGEYIDEQVIRNFEKEFGVRVNYSLNSTPEEMYTKLQTGASFDVIVTRNLTWNLTDPLRAYRDWMRVLRPGGAMLVFDADWYGYLVDTDKQQAWDLDRENVRLAACEDHDGYAESRLMEEISRRLPMTGRRRPDWDLDALRALGCAFVTADTGITDRVWNPEEKLNYASTPGFLIHAVKS